MGRIETLRRHRASVLAIGVALLSASCGSGGGSSLAPTPANRAPSFTSATSASAIENVTGAVYTPVAIDPDGDTVTARISGGADAAAFTLTGGSLSFVSPPNFDRPTDLTGDNAYDLTLSASDGKGTAELALTVQVTNDHEGVNLTQVASGLGIDAAMAPRGRMSGLLVVSQDGAVRLVDATSGSPQRRQCFQGG